VHLPRASIPGINGIAVALYRGGGTTEEHAMPVPDATQATTGIWTGLLDGAGGMAAIALLVIVGVLLIRRFGALE
jgi:hypothetical protein